MYRIIEAESHDALERKINDLAQEGYRLISFVIHDASDNGFAGEYADKFFGYVDPLGGKGPFWAVMVKP